MNRSGCSGFLMLGFLGGMVIAGNAGAQSEAGAGEGRYSGASGSQALQEQMYEDRMRELLGEPAQGGQQAPGMQRQTDMKGAEESSQKMQQDQRQSGSQGRQGDQMIEEKGKSKSKK
jgi:hypothetical protein